MTAAQARRRRRPPPRDNRVTVVIPVGPEPRHRRYLPEAVASALAIPEAPEVLIVDDMAGLEPADLGLEARERPWTADLEVLELAGGRRIYVHRPAWRLGVPGAFNVGVALARTQFSLLLGADDTLEPGVIGAFRRACPMPLREGAERTYWALAVRYMDTGEVQTLPCNAAIVPRALWERTGGFPPESAVGACDTMLLSILIAHGAAAGEIRLVSEEPLYNYRRHAETETATRAAWQQPIFVVRDLLTREWKPSTWGRYT